MGETRWNRRATRGSAASQTTADARTALRVVEPRRRRSLIHQGSSFRSSSSSGDRGPHDLRTDVLGHLQHQAMGRRHQPDQGADGQERELAAHVEEEEGVQRERQEPGQGQGVRRAGVAVHDRGEAERQRHDGRSDDRGGQADEQGVADGDQGDPAVGDPAGQPREAEQEGQGRGQHLELEARDGEEVRRAGPREGVVVVGVDALPLAEDQGRGQRGGPCAEPLGQAPAAGGAEVADQSSQRCLGAAGVERQMPAGSSMESRRRMPWARRKDR